MRRPRHPPQLSFRLTHPDRLRRQREVIVDLLVRHSGGGLVIRLRCVVVVVSLLRRVLRLSRRISGMRVSVCWRLVTLFVSQ
jgi:hypothetical protein